MTRLNRRASYKVVERRRVNKGKGPASDQTICATGRMADCIPIPLRRVGYRDPKTGRHYVSPANLFHLEAGDAAVLYKAC